MAFVFNFPDVGEGIHEGRVVEWLVAEGEVVVEDQPLLKVETDKAVVELPSPNAGTVLRLHAAADSAIFVGDALVTIGEAGEDAGGEPAAAARTCGRGTCSGSGAGRSPGRDRDCQEAVGDTAYPRHGPQARCRSRDRSGFRLRRPHHR